MRGLSNGLRSFSVVVEGYQSILGMLTEFEDEVIYRKKVQLNRTIVEMAESFESGNLSKSNELIQFSLLPTLRTLNRALIGRLAF